MWSTIRQVWAKHDIFEVGPEGELTELAQLRSLTCRVRRMKSFICQSWATYCVFVGINGRLIMDCFTLSINLKEYIKLFVYQNTWSLISMAKIHEHLALVMIIIRKK